MQRFKTPFSDPITLNVKLRFLIIDHFYALLLCRNHRGFTAMVGQVTEASQTSVVCDDSMKLTVFLFQWTN